MKVAEAIETAKTMEAGTPTAGQNEKCQYQKRTPATVAATLTHSLNLNRNSISNSSAINKGKTSIYIDDNNKDSMDSTKILTFNQYL